MPSRLSRRGEGVEVVAGRDGVEDEVEAAGVRAPSRRLVARDDHLVGAERVRVLALALRGGEHHHVRAHRVRDLDAHVAEPAEADDADLLAGADLPVPQRRVGGDAGAQQRRDGGELVLGMADLQHELLVDHDALRVAAERVAGRVRRRAVVGAGEAVLAVLLEAVRRRTAQCWQLSTRQPTPDGVADLELRDMRRRRR